MPLTGCVGARTSIAQATGLVEDVIPTPNIYSGGLVEIKAAAARDALRSGRFRDGTPMADLPPFVTEMNRDELSLQRMLSVGFKGLGPFNFAGGSNHGRWESVNNWGGFSWMATSIDFSGMIGFDGRRGAVFADARRIAGCISAFEEFIALADPTAELARAAALELPRAALDRGSAESAWRSLGGCAPAPGARTLTELSCLRARQRLDGLGVHVAAPSDLLP
ncbi:MAG: hypothetical protein H0V44_11840 [Planctomycetes bacterium]|nr:hypothetical protein [Planctomycetota bacterium]